LPLPAASPIALTLLSLMLPLPRHFLRCHAYAAIISYAIVADDTLRV